jgi:hypothetical protein
MRPLTCLVDLLGVSGKNLREQGDGEQAEAADAGFGKTDDHGGECGEDPLPGFERHFCQTVRSGRLLLVIGRW